MSDCPVLLATHKTDVIVYLTGEHLGGLGPWKL